MVHVTVFKSGEWFPILLYRETYQPVILPTIGHMLAEIAVFLNTHRLTAVRIHFKNPMPRPCIGDRLDPASHAAGLKKLPSREALEALSAISSHPLDQNEQVFLRIAAPPRSQQRQVGFRIETERIPLPFLKPVSPVNPT